MVSCIVTDDFPDCSDLTISLLDVRGSPITLSYRLLQAIDPKNHLLSIFVVQS